MAERKYYALCANNCKYETLTKEQILTAIQQAAETGEIKDVDTGFVTTIKEKNHGVGLTFWIGTTAEYNAIETKAENCFYICTDDVTGDELKKDIEELKASVEGLEIGAPMYAQIVVTPRGGSVECFDENERLVAGKKTEGKFIFTVQSFGTYTIQSEYGAYRDTRTVKVDTVKQYFETVEFYDETFANNSWETIVDLAQRGVAPDTWKVGDKKDYVGGVQICILGKFHDTYEDGTKANLTLGVIPYTGNNGYYGQIHSSSSIKTWKAMDMYKITIPEFISQLPEAIQNGMRAVEKHTVNYNGETSITYDKAFIMSVGEVLGGTGTEGTQYEYFKNGNNYTSGMTMWTRTYNTNNTYKTITNYHELDSDLITGRNDYYPAFCF